MAQDISQATDKDLIGLLNRNINQSDSSLDTGLDAYNKWTAWRAQHVDSDTAASDLNTKSGTTYITATLIDQWASAFAGFKHLSDSATGIDTAAKDMYFDWNKMIN